MSMITESCNTQSRLGFTLIELSIVLVIIGLLVGGVLTGKSLIRTSELRSVISQCDQIVIAVRAFKDKYGMLPGDINTATQIWGVANASPMVCAQTPSGDTKTCNGNGDGYVSTIAYQGGVVISYESSRFWQHLANATLIPGQYTGSIDNSLYGAGPGNSLPLKLANSYWATTDNPSYFCYGFCFGGGTASVINRLGPVLVPVTLPDPSFMSFDAGSLVLTAPDVWSIDSKVDDGKPGLGKVVVYSSNGLDKCTTATGSAIAQMAAMNSDYLLTSDVAQCSPMFAKQY